ncbi:Thioredoxin domain-containing protein 5 [Orchesella cincta]|uniref:Thioredoxin domain-containing protein 5 n=1 Tax=Orchesella cincta TaxID=48709 RepID=A0A1D2M214_ORCCI|nr:Thioredoxin domain-containing protein 5 [Orchesella cincta]
MGAKIHLSMVCMQLLFAIVLSQQENPSSNSVDSVVKYNTQEFVKYVPRRNHYVYFYAPWSGECKNVAGIWEELALRFNKNPDGDVVLAKVDCTTETDLCTKHTITDYPTVKFFKTGGDPLGIRYRGAIDLASLEQFMNGNIGKEAEFIYGARVPAIPEPEWGLHKLQDESFNDAMNSVTRAFVSFCTPWSSKCMDLEPVWKEVAKEFRFEDDFIVGTVDCVMSKSTCNENEVRGYPSLLWLQDGVVFDKYPTTNRTFENLREWVLKKLGKDKVRTVPAGVEEEMDPTEIINLSKEDFYKAMEAKQMLFVQFWTPWCSLCLELDNTWEALASNFNDKADGEVPKILISNFDCTINKDTCEELGVDDFPTLNVYKHGKLYKTYKGDLKIDPLTIYVQKIVDGKDEL